MQKSPLRRVVREGFFYCLLCVDHFVQRGLTQLQIVVVQIFVIGFLKGLIGFFQFIQILMDILLFVDLNENTGDIGAVVGNAFDVCQQILVNIAQFHGAFFVLQPLDVAVFQFQVQCVDDFFQRFDLVRNGEVILFKCLECQIQRYQQSVAGCAAPWQRRRRSAVPFRAVRVPIP